MHMFATNKRSQPPAQARRRWSGLPRWCGALALVAAAAYQGNQLALQTGTARLREAAEHRLDMLATGLDADLARFDYLPALLEMRYLKALSRSRWAELAEKATSGAMRPSRMTFWWPKTCAVHS